MSTKIEDSQLVGEIFIVYFLLRYIIESKSRDERDSPLTQYITNAGISHARYTITTITHFKHHHHALQLISNRMNV